MTKKIHGNENDPASQDVSDAVGEITNMIAGGCKSRLSDEGFNLYMSIPNILRGNAIKAVAKDIDFIIKRQFNVPEVVETIDLIILGKTE